MKRLLMLSVAVMAVGFLSTACGSNATANHDMSSMSPIAAQPTPTTSAAADHNNQDVMFAQMMIPHHQQAVDMAKLAETRASKADVKELAKQIEAAQDPEIQMMSDWLKSWGVAMPSTMPTMDHGMPGMMPEADMKKLEGLSGAAFDKAVLEMMIKHHEGAIEMARQELSSGASEPAKKLADAIISGQSAEITKMKQLLQ
jgi:uncharacterized protein (DUF305 family)